MLPIVKRLLHVETRRESWLLFPECVTWWEKWSSNMCFQLRCVTSKPNTDGPFFTLGFGRPPFPSNLWSRPKPGSAQELDTGHWTTILRVVLFYRQVAEPPTGHSRTARTPTLPSSTQVHDVGGENTGFYSLMKKPLQRLVNSSWISSGKANLLFKAAPSYRKETNNWKWALSFIRASSFVQWHFGHKIVTRVKLCVIS